MYFANKSEVDTTLVKDFYLGKCAALSDAISECRELNPWLPLEEFLKSGFEGKCWVCTREKVIIECDFNGVAFSYGRRATIYVIFVTHVQPIYKPEPPR